MKAYYFWGILAGLTLLAILIVISPLLRSYERERPTHKLTIILMLIGLPLCSISLYLHWGASGSLENYWALKSQHLAMTHPQRLLIELKQVLKAHPESDRGWFLLGELYLSMKDYSQSRDALRRAYELKPMDSTYALVYAKVLSRISNSEIITH